MKRIYLAILAATLAASQASAYTLTVEWTAPTTRVNGDPLPAAELSHYTLYHLVDGQPPQFLLRVDGAANTRGVLENVGIGCYTLGATATDTEGHESEMSAPVSKCIKGPPRAPAGLKAGVSK